MLQNPVNICLFEVNNKSTRERCEICSKLIIKTPERRHGQIQVKSFVAFAMFLMLTLNRQVFSGKYYETLSRPP